MPCIQSIDNTVYVICVIRRNKETSLLQYVPLVFLANDLKSFTIAASGDLLGVQLKNQQAIVELTAAGSPVITIPVSVEKFKSITDTVSSNLTESVNAYLDACHEYDSVLGILGGEGKVKNLKYYLYTMLVNGRPPCVLTSELNICKPEELDVLACLGEAAKISEDGSDAMVSTAIETLQYVDDDDDDADEDFDEDDFGNLYS